MFTHKVVHCTLSGTMLGGADEWQTGFWLGQPDADAADPTQAAADAVRNAWITFFTTPSVNISSSFQFTQCKLAKVNEAGKYYGVEPAVSYPAAAVNGPGAGSPLPPQVTLVATLIAGSGKGLAGKGRMYLPGIKETIDGGGKLPTVFVQGVATKLADFFNTVNATIGMPGQAINASAGHSKMAGIGARNVPLNGVRVGNVYDTQRRRRNAISETYSNAVIID